jgi:hypothetical protein
MQYESFTFVLSMFLLPSLVGRLGYRSFTPKRWSCTTRKGAANGSFTATTRAPSPASRSAPTAAAAPRAKAEPSLLC